MKRLHALLVLALAPALAFLAPLGAGSPATPVTDVTAPLVTAVAWVAWACTAWLGLVVAVTFGAQLPGALGRTAQRVALHVAPASVRALVRVALGVGVAASVLAGPSFAYANPTPPPAASYEWPGGEVPPAAEPSPLPVPADLDWPGASPAPTTTTTATPVAHPAPAAPTVRHATAAAPRAVLSVSPDRGRDVLVRAGDSLWGIAADRLGSEATDAQIAQAWPRWWAANRVLVGDDPGLILPGTRLTPPSS
jgi:nucleoid-associated protein YgaU